MFALLPDTLDLLHRHNHQNRPVMNRGAGPGSAEWHSLWGKLSEIREDATAGDAECRDWLALHHSLIQAVEVCRAHALMDAITYRAPSR